MDTGMRDLDRIEEKDDNGPGRKVAVVLLAALATVGLVFAMGMVLGNSAEGEPPKSEDPLAALDRAAGLQAHAEPAQPADPKVDQKQLVFPQALSDADDRPEVAAAIAAAAAEQAHPDPIDPSEDTVGATADSDSDADADANTNANTNADANANANANANDDGVNATRPTRPAHHAVHARNAAPPDDADAAGSSVQAVEDDDAAQAAAAATSALPAADDALPYPSSDSPTTPPAVVPAALAAGHHHVAAAPPAPPIAHRDPMVATVPVAAPPRPTAHHAEDGPYMLQVISYVTRADAERFAADLRARGHDAFVVSADVPGRGTYYRVRIGPFRNKAKAEAYRHQFEQQEQMNTIVVKRRDDDR